jgi:hypothetical protein
MHTGKMTLVSLHHLSHHDADRLPDVFAKFGVKITAHATKEHLDPPGIQMAAHTTYEVATDEKLRDMFTTLAETWKFYEIVPDFDPDNDIYKTYIVA